MNRAAAIETARAVLSMGRSYGHADAMALALYVLEVNQGVEVAFSPSATSCGGGPHKEDPAAPESAPVSTESDAVSPARNLGGPSGPLFPEETFTMDDMQRPSTTASVPTVYPTAGMAWQDERIAVWLEGHADGYEHSGYREVAEAMREKARKIRRREYLEP